MTKSFKNIAMAGPWFSELEKNMSTKLLKMVGMEKMRTNFVTCLKTRLLNIVKENLH